MEIQDIQTLKMTSKKKYFDLKKIRPNYKCSIICISNKNIIHVLSHGDHNYKTNIHDVDSI